MKRGKQISKLSLQFLTFNLFLILIFIPSLYAVELSFSKESYQPEELFQAEIIGNFLTLSNDNILIYEGNSVHSTPVISNLVFQNDKYYFYAILPSKEGNYSLKIEDSEYYNNGKLAKETIQKNFEIKSSDASYLSIKPGVILTDKDFSIKVKSPRGNQEITAIFSNNTDSYSLIESEEKTLSFLISDAGKNEILKINNYEIPVFITKQITQPNPVVNNKKIQFIPAEIKGIVYQGETYSFKFILANPEEENFTDIKLSSDLGIIINPNLIKNLNSKETKIINITINSTKDIKKLSGILTAEYGNEKSSLPISFNITSKREEVDINDAGISDNFNCNEIGFICDSNQQCNGEVKKSLQGACCIGECTEQEDPYSNYKWIVTGVLVFALILVLIWVILKVMKRRQKPKSSEDILKEKSERYNKRINPETTEVRRRLGRV